MKAVADPADLPACETCGQVHLTRYNTPACTGHSRGRLRPEIAGKACRTSPMQGQDVCKNHGGNAPQNKAAGAERAAASDTQRRVQALAATFGAVPDGDTKDPAEIVAEQIQWRYWHVQWLRSRVQALDPKQLIWGRTKKKVGGDDHGTTSEAKAHAWLVLYEQWSEKLEKLCLAAVAAGLEERRVRLAEQQADAVVRVIDGLLVELGFDPTDVVTAEKVERHLRLLVS